MLTDLILGTAGHIDHGKTSLIRALTGTDTDRLPEEKKRGITIELGYAQLELPPFRLGIVDVPGHEKFVRQMLAGATGMDLALLVIAADDSIKQQTTEHLDILRMLDLEAGVIALTKCDLSDPEWIELVEEEIRQLVSDTFLKDAPIVRTSSKTGAGIETLKSQLRLAAQIVADKATTETQTANAPFRMAIDRAFTIDGHGTVVTGSVSSGVLKTGESLSIEPGHTIARVRSLQNHDSAADSVKRGQRAAINLAGISLEEVERGHELCTPGHLAASQLMTVRMDMLGRVDKPFKDRTRVRFHIGTAELFGNIRLLEGPEVQPGQSALCQIFLSEPAVAVWNQPFVVRRQSPVETIGGGRVLHPNSSRIRKPTQIDLTMVNQLSNADPIQRASAAIYLTNNPQWKSDELARTAGIADPASIVQALIETGVLAEVRISPTRTITVHQQRLAELSLAVLKTLVRLHEQHPLRFSHARNVLENEFSWLEQTELLNLAIENLKQNKQVVANVNSVGLQGYGPKLSKGQTQLMNELVDQLKSSELNAPLVKELLKSTTKHKDSVLELLELATENGQLEKISKDLYLHSDTVNEVKSKLTDSFGASQGLTLSEIRQVLDTSRKYAVPLCEFLDETGFTIRNGDKRLLAR